MIMNNIKKAVKYIAVPLLVGAVAAFLTRDSMNIYQNIVQPPLAPPGWLFPVVWTILYTLMGISSYIISQTPDLRRKSALTVYALQLAVNFFWSLIFFNARAYLFAFIWLLLLWVLIIVMIQRFAKISKPAAYLQIPYLLWVTFAGYLNLAIYILNR